MSIIIKGMRMPASCAGCYMFLHGLTMDGHPWQECAAAERELDDLFGCGKPDWCPVTELSPHGRLGDLDKLEKMFADIDSAPYSGFDGAEPFYSAEDAAHIIKLAPTVIPADESNMDSFIRIFEEDDEEDGMDSFIRILKD